MWRALTRDVTGHVTSKLRETRGVGWQDLGGGGGKAGKILTDQPVFRLGSHVSTSERIAVMSAIER